MSACPQCQRVSSLVGFTPICNHQPAPPPIMPRPDVEGARLKPFDDHAASVRALATDLGFLPGGSTASEAERVIAAHIERVRADERQRLAALLGEREADANDTAARLRRAGDAHDTADAFAGQARTWHRASRLVLGYR